ncbi:MAG: hypothetical protein JWN25_3071 [Verrucomicrobiales bacterium]|nr:hypothetical protein [Verrucomicrobiales bacterium]
MEQPLNCRSFSSYGVYLTQGFPAICQGKRIQPGYNNLRTKDVLLFRGVQQRHTSHMFWDRCSLNLGMAADETQAACMGTSRAFSFWMFCSMGMM